MSDLVQGPTRRNELMIKRNGPFRSILMVFSVVAVVFIGFCLYVRWQADQTRKNAESLLSELGSMRVGETDLAEVQRLATSQSRFLAKGTDPFCQDEFCTYAFSYDTSILGKLSYWGIHPWRLYLTPGPVEFTAWLDVRRDRLVRIGTLLASGIVPGTVAANVTDEVADISPVSQPYLYRAQGSYISVYVKPSATAAQHEAAYSFNLNCIVKSGGCRRAEELLPKAQ